MKPFHQESCADMICMCRRAVKSSPSYIYANILKLTIYFVLAGEKAGISNWCIERNE
jgi:hypothetical protein